MTETADQPTPRPGQPGEASPWWSDALNDPWRDPQSPAVVVARTPPSPPPPPQLTGPAPSARPGFGLFTVIVVLSTLLAGALGGAVGYAAAVRRQASAVVLGAAAGGVPPAAQRAPGSVAGVAAQVLPSVVTVHAGIGQAAESIGSGFVISRDGYVLTNDHVISGADQQRVRVAFSDSTTAFAAIVGRDQESDLAVLKVSQGEFTPVEFGDSDALAVGDPVLAVGSPLALPGTVTSGIVSALDRAIQGGEVGGPVRYYAAIQTDAAINRGNSGGPLFDTAGRVIGINAVIKSLAQREDEAGNIGIGFAIPINHAKRVAAELVDTGRARRTVIGAQLDTTPDANGGVRLVTVDEGGPAEGAGLRRGDVVVRLGAHPIEAPVDLIALVRRYPPRTAITVQYRRGAATRTARVTLAADAN